MSVTCDGCKRPVNTAVGGDPYWTPEGTGGRTLCDTCGWKWRRCQMANERQESTQMTVRERFVMAAMQGLLANPRLEMFIQMGDGPIADRLAATAAHLADVQLAELAKEKPNG